MSLIDGMLMREMIPLLIGAILLFLGWVSYRAQDNPARLSTYKGERKMAYGLAIFVLAVFALSLRSALEAGVLPRTAVLWTAVGVVAAVALVVLKLLQARKLKNARDGQGQVWK